MCTKREGIHYEQEPTDESSKHPRTQKQAIRTSAAIHHGQDRLLVFSDHDNHEYRWCDCACTHKWEQSGSGYLRCYSAHHYYSGRDRDTLVASIGLPARYHYPLPVFHPTLYY